MFNDCKNKDEKNKENICETTFLKIGIIVYVFLQKSNRAYERNIFSNDICEQQNHYLEDIFFFLKIYIIVSIKIEIVYFFFQKNLYKDFLY